MKHIRRFKRQRLFEFLGELWFLWQFWISLRFPHGDGCWASWDWFHLWRGVGLEATLLLLVLENTYSFLKYMASFLFYFGGYVASCFWCAIYVQPDLSKNYPVFQIFQPTLPWLKSICSYGNVNKSFNAFYLLWVRFTRQEFCLFCVT